VQRTEQPALRSASRIATFQSGRIRVDGPARVVVVDGRPVKLGGRAFDLLEALMGRRDRVIPKQELLDVVWPGLIVEENNLQVHVVALRKLFGPGSIRTVSGRGYQFALAEDSSPVAATTHWPGADQASVDESTRRPGTSLIGRDELIASACALLRRDDVRLVSLVGPGGSGKTRVGLRMTAELAHDFADGSYIVLLAPVRDAAHVASTIAGVLNVQEAGNAPLEDLLIAYLRERSVLLTLDNFEHVLAAAPLAKRLLEQCPHIKILVTSRVVLRLSDERHVLVPPLSVPAAHATALQALKTPAVQLFADRARAAGREIEDHPADVAATIDICRRLEGLPLALELAAARLRVLTPNALAQRLRNALTVLTGGASDAPDRQRTLRDAIAWSYGLLDADEQALFRRLAVFVGGWTLDAAEAVASDGLSKSVLDLLSSLIDHSLVQRTEDVGDDSRFAMLEMVREFALELFEASGEAEALRARHADWFIGLAERVDPRLRTGARAPWLARLRVDYPNLRAALAWFVIETHNTAGALRMVAALSWYWYFAGQFSEGRGWIGLALALPGAEARDVARARTLSGAARLAMYAGAVKEAQALAHESVEIFRAVSDRHGLALALLHLGIPMIILKDREAASAALGEAEECFRSLGDEWGAAVALSYRGTNLALHPGFEDEARTLLNEGRVRCQALGDDWAVTTSSHYLGTIALRLQDYAAARKLTEEMLIIARELGDNYRISRNLHQLGEIALAQGQADESARHVRSSIALNHEQGRTGDIAVQLRFLAALEAGQSRHERAVALYGAASRLEGHTTTIPTDDPARHEQARAALKAALGERGYEAQWAKGAAMTLEQAVTFATSSSFL
jgi:predicted ATPase/DNA-binding winged helix-turn-helix (wHTH) protein